MSTSRNPLAPLQTNVFETRKRGKATASAVEKHTGHQQRSDGENGNQEIAEPRSTTKKTSAKDSRKQAERAVAETTAIKEQYLKELNDKKADETRLGNIGRIIARLFLPFHDLNDPLHWALKRQAGHRLKKEFRKLAQLRDDIFEAFEDLPDLIVKYGLFFVETTLTKARNNARTADTFKIRNIIMKCHEWGIPPEDWNDKSKRGWANEDMAKLLFPDHSAYNSDAVQLYAVGDAHISELDIPCLVYADGNSDDMAGFLRGDYLLKAGAGLLQGSQAAMGGSRAPSNTAKKHHIMSVTEVFIIYVICLVRFALSSEKNFTPEGAEGFDYLEFFDALEEEIENFKAAGRSGAGALAVKEIIEHWNKSIFASRRKPDNDNDKVIEAISAKYRVQRRLEWAALAEKQMAARAAEEEEGSTGAPDGDEEPGLDDAEKLAEPLFFPASEATPDRAPLADKRRGPIDEDEDDDSGNDNDSDNSAPRAPSKKAHRQEPLASPAPSPRASPSPSSKRKQKSDGSARPKKQARNAK